MVVMEDGGAGWRLRRTAGGARFKGAAVLDSGQRLAGELAAGMGAAIADIHRVLTQGGEPASSGETALAAQRLAEEIGSRSLARAAAQGAGREFGASTASATLSSAFLSTRSPATLPALTEVHEMREAHALRDEPDAVAHAARTGRGSSAPALAQA
jgi:hypothetical protein